MSEPYYIRSMSKITDTNTAKATCEQRINTFICSYYKYTQNLTTPNNFTLNPDIIPITGSSSSWSSYSSSSYSSLR